MTNMQIQERNKTIAIFMGFEPIGDWLKFPHGGDQVHVSALTYHSDWKYLMAVVAKIVDCRYEDGEYSYLKEFGMRNLGGEYVVRFNRYGHISGPTLIEATYNAVYDFLQ